MVTRTKDRARPTAAFSPARERSATLAVWLIVLATIVLLPDAFVRWFLPKDALAAISVAVASVGVARGRLPRWFVGAAIASASLAVVSVLMSAAPAVQLWGRWPRYEGLVTLPVYFGALWAGARLLGPAAPGPRQRTLVRAAATAAIALGLVSMLEALGAGPFPSDLARPGSLAGNATDQGILGALLLAVLLLPVLRAWSGATAAHVGSRARSAGPASARRPAPAALPTLLARPALPERLWLTAALVMAAASVILSASRAGLLAAGVVVCVLFALEVVRRGHGFAVRTIGVGLASLLVLLGGALAVPFTRDRLLGSSPLAGSSLQSRFTFWQDSLTVLAGHPLGVGASGFLNANSAASTGTETLDSPHNLLLQVAMAGGIPLVALVLVIVVATCVTGLRLWFRSARGETDTPRADLMAAGLAGLAGFGVALLTHFTAPSTTVLAALLLGVLLARAPAGTPAPARAPESTPARAPAPASAPARALAPPALRLTATGIRTLVLVGWALWLVVLMSAEVPLAAGVSAAGRGDLAAADAAFDSARTLRPWDGDLAGIAAQSFAAGADAQVPGAADLAVEWAERSRAVLPGTVSTERALAIGQLNSGDPQGAQLTLAALADLAPQDVAVAVQHAVALYLVGDISGSAAEARRALVLDPDEPTALRLREILFAG